MCIIVVKPAERDWSPDLVKSMIISSNYDGFGMMWVEDGRVRSVKSMGTTDEKVDIYKEHMDKGDLAIHVRHATHGKKNLENCHPYQILDKDLGDKMDLYMMHNGTIHGVQVDDDYSDSWNFATKFMRNYLRPRPETIVNPDFLYLVTGMIGDGNKLVFLDSKSRWNVVNSAAGSYQGGCWVSTRAEIRPFKPVPAGPIMGSWPKTNNNDNSGSSSSSATKHPINAGSWTTDSDGRSHFVANNHRGAGGSEQSSSADDDKEGHTPKIQEVATVPAGAPSAKQKSSQSQNIPNQIGLPLGTTGGLTGGAAAEDNSIIGDPHGAWTGRPKVSDLSNETQWGQEEFDPAEVATLDKKEILQLVLSAPLEVVDYIWSASQVLTYPD